MRIGSAAPAPHAVAASAQQRAVEVNENVDAFREVMAAQPKPDMQSYGEALRRVEQAAGVDMSQMLAHFRR